MGIRIEKIDLPGIGMRHDLVTESGRRLSVVSYRDGERNLGIFDVDDPDACRDSIPITEDEAEALADVLGTSVTLSRLTKLSADTEGLYTEQLELADRFAVHQSAARRHQGAHPHARLHRRHRARARR